MELERQQLRKGKLCPSFVTKHFSGGPMEKRRHRRYTRRFKVRFGEKTFTQTGFTSDVSATGLFVVTNATMHLNTRVHVEVNIDAERQLFFEGIVARLAIVSPELRQIMKGGFGMRFLTGAELMAEMVPHLKDKTRCVLTYATQAAFAESYEKELKRGGGFVWAEKSHPVNSIINLEIDAPFIGRLLAFEARVVHVMPGPNNTFGTALMFIDPASALQSLQSLLPVT